VKRLTGLPVLACAVALAAAPPAGATSPGDNGRIFFSARAPASQSGCGIASVNPSGTGYNCLDRGGRDPAVSPDNSRIASTRGVEPVEVYVSDINGRGVRRLTDATSTFPSSYAPSFSPDSRRIVWNKFGGAEGQDGIYLMDADGGGHRQLTSDGGQDPVFSPSGAQIAYSVGGHSIAVADADGANSHVILGFQNHATTNPLGHYLEQNREPTWAPDGSRLAFSRHTRVDTIDCVPAPPACSGGHTEVADDLYSMNADGSDIRQLTSSPDVDELDPSWSPDGSQIAFYRRPEGRGNEFGEVWVMNAEGSGQRRVALGANPEWSTLQGGPGRPKLVFRFKRINRHRSCLARFDGWTAAVKTSGQRQTLFYIAFYVDGRFMDYESNSRFLGMGVDAVRARRGSTHRVRVVVEDAAPGDRTSRTFTFRRC
jgi:dipeptidyl aminopeptidase/acylaminoacyl peptidase